MGELKEIVEFLKANKVIQYKKGDLELVFSPMAFESEFEPNLGEEETLDEPDEDLLYWSSDS